jgi:hypothetical protein
MLSSRLLTTMLSSRLLKDEAVSRRPEDMDASDVSP